MRHYADFILDLFDSVEIAHETLIRTWPRLGEWLDADHGQGGVLPSR
jgi:hypothetical protein